MSSTRISYHINARRASVYRALLDARAIPKWKVPDGMTCQVHALDKPESRCSMLVALAGARPVAGTSAPNY